MIQRIFVVLPPPFERPHARVPLVVSAQAITCACDAKCRVASNKIWLRQDYLHRLRPLGTFHLSDERPEQMERPEYLVDRKDPPTAIGLARRLCLSQARDRAHSNRVLKANELGRSPVRGGLGHVEDRNEEIRMRPMLVEARGSLAIKEASRPGELLAHRARPNDWRQWNAKRPLELSSLDRAKPRSDPFEYAHQVGARCCFPGVERLPALENDRSLDPPDANDSPELGEHLGDSAAPSLVDARLHAPPATVRPALAVEESGGPSKVVALQPRELDRTGRACLSPKRAKTSSKCASAVA